ncbi:MAG: hypothetical protein ACTSW1_00725 [Candidatus Hodarchaeales archaeon]
MNKKYLLLPVVMVLLGASFLAGQFTATPRFGTINSEGATHEGFACFKVIRADGTVEDLGCGHNTYMNVGKNVTSSQLFSKPTAASATNIVDTIVLGNGSSAENAALTSHPGKITDCGLTEASVTWSMVPGSDGNVTASHEWTSTCDNVVVNTTGLETHAGDDKYFAGKDFTASTTLQANDKLNVTWYVWST